MMTKPGVKMSIAVFLLSAGRVAAADFPLPADAQWEMIKYPAGYGCGLFAENQSQKGKGWFISGSAPSTEAECRRACDAQIAKAQTEYQGKNMSVVGTCFLGKKPLYSTALGQSSK
jgi:hypothetical protein